MQTRYRLLPLCLIALTAVIYYPFLNSPFVFDDFYNLFALEQVNQNGYLSFLAEGFSGPTGRPASLLSFALQHESWPANPFDFKLVNLLIHLMNGLLIGFISFRLTSATIDDVKLGYLCSCITMALWLLHPMHLSTVLYTVQRMTQLSALFTLSGIAFYLVGRQWLVKNENIAGYVIVAAGVLCCTVLAILSKENGILLLLFIPVIEFTILAKNRQPNYIKPWLVIVVLTPLLIFIAYLLYILPGTLQSYHFRDFNAGQRLLTQAIILFDYLKDLILPSYGAFTLYHDNYQVSTGILAPVTTAIALISIIALLIFSIVKRKTYPLFSFCCLWFLAGHSLEASHLNLELYFEHRNYLPGFSIFFGISHIFILIINKTRKYTLGLGAAMIYVSWTMTVLVLEGNLWNKPLYQAVEWSRLHPGSSRITGNLASMYMHYSEFEKAESTYKQLVSIKPDSIYPDLQIIRIKLCKGKHAGNNAGWDEVYQKSQNARPEGQHIIGLLDLMIFETLEGKCKENTLANIDKLLDILLINENFAFLQGHLYQFKSTIELTRKDYNSALKYIDKALTIKQSADNYTLKLQLLRQLNKQQEYIETIKAIEQHSAINPLKRYMYSEIIKEFK